jgi:hypothetical protein
MKHPTCKTCQFFKRGRWIEELGGGEQLGGNCKLLYKLLYMTNSHVISFSADVLYIQETFGCCAHQCKEHNEKTRNHN